MYLSAYHFEGDPADLTAAYDRLSQMFPLDTLDLHVCIEHPVGVTVFDACETIEIAEAFLASDEFRGAVRAAGLPVPRVERLGEVYNAIAAGATVIAR